jgi:hypothetical protein
MVWHQQNKVRPSFTSLVAKLDRIEHPVSNFTSAKVVAASWVATNGNEVNRLVGPNPRGNIVGVVCFGTVDSHAGDYSDLRLKSRQRWRSRRERPTYTVCSSFSSIAHLQMKVD